MVACKLLHILLYFDFHRFDLLFGIRNGNKISSMMIYMTMIANNKPAMPKILDLHQVHRTLLTLQAHFQPASYRL